MLSPMNLLKILHRANQPINVQAMFFCKCKNLGSFKKERKIHFTNVTNSMALHQAIQSCGYLCVRGSERVQLFPQTLAVHAFALFYLLRTNMTVSIELKNFNRLHMGLKHGIFVILTLNYLFFSLKLNNFILVVLFRSQAEICQSEDHK